MDAHPNNEPVLKSERKHIVEKGGGKSLACFIAREDEWEKVLRAFTTLLSIFLGWRGKEANELLCENEALALTHALDVGRCDCGQ